MSSNQTHLTFLSLSFSLSSQTMFPELPFCKPPKNPIFITGLSKEQYFSPSYVGFLGFFVLVRVSHRENRKARTFLPLPLFSLSCAFSFLISFSHVLFHHPLTQPTFSFLFLSLSVSLSVSLSLSLPFLFRFRFFFPCGFSCFSLIP